MPEPETPVSMTTETGINGGRSAVRGCLRCVGAGISSTADRLLPTACCSRFDKSVVPVRAVVDHPDFVRLRVAEHDELIVGIGQDHRRFFRRHRLHAIAARGNDARSGRRGFYRAARDWRNLFDRGAAALPRLKLLLEPER